MLLCAKGEGEEHLSFMIKQLACEELLSDEHHLELDKALIEDELDSSHILEVIKGTKVRPGLNFLSLVKRLRRNMPPLLTKYIVKNKM